MVKSFEDLREGDRVLFVYPHGRKRILTCSKSPVNRTDDPLLASGEFFSPRDSGMIITRDRNFQIPVFAQSNEN